MRRTPEQQDGPGVPRDVSAEETFAADLVVDVTGRGSRTPAWLKTWGYAQPPEERVAIGLGYATAYYERTAAAASDNLVVLCTPTAEVTRGGVLLAQEPAHGNEVARWVLTYSGYAGDHPAPTADGMRERAASLGSSQIDRVVHSGKLIGEVLRYGFPHSQRRRYERLHRFPANYLVMGDALASFNPVYGQGMTVASLEAVALRDALVEGLTNVHCRFFTAAAKIIDTPWQIAVGSDLAIPTVEGERPLSVRVVNAYLGRVFRAAQKDPHVALAFFKVMHMLEEPPSLFKPNIFARVMWRGWKTEKAASKPIVAPVRPEPEDLTAFKQSGSW